MGGVAHYLSHSQLPAFHLYRRPPLPPSINSSNSGILTAVALLSSVFFPNRRIFIPVEACYFTFVLVPCFRRGVRMILACQFGTAIRKSTNPRVTVIQRRSQSTKIQQK
ncbi:hypothetical protein PIB30_059647 [Stylosanthes scabra]|uniref:Uncharacterized protein n=1 Tax=Stylosanthes scabra TaxID=79078 RepID=A0ABU6QKS2_9FABA|nr:hypothetical protein [Stylosanthes scabra]